MLIVIKIKYKYKNIDVSNIGFTKILKFDLTNKTFILIMVCIYLILIKKLTKNSFWLNN